MEMKKFYLVLGLSGLVASVGAQELNRGNFKAFKKQLVTEKVTTPAAEAFVKAPGDELWRDNFDTISDWTIDNAGETTVGWFFTDNGTGTQGWPSFVSNGMNSTSGGNFAELFNGDPNPGGTPAPVSATFSLTSEVINLPMAGVDIVFEQEGALFQDNQEVYVTVDGGASWVLVGDNTEMGVLSSTGGSAYPEPHTQKFDLGAALTAAGFSAPGNIQIRFQWSPDVQNITYGWLVDDVRITEKEGNDLAMSQLEWYHNTFSTIVYTMVPTSQLAPMSFTAFVENKGAYDQPNTTLSVSVSGAGSGSATNVPYTSLSSALDKVTATSFTPSVTGSYTASYVLTSDSVDADPTNNSGSLSWEVTNFTYGKDEGAFTGWYGPFDDDGDGLDDPYEVISEFEINNATTIYGLQAVFHAGIGEEIYYNMYELDGSGAFVAIFDGLTVPIPTRVLTAADISTTSGSENWVNLIYPTPVSADPAVSQSYFPVIGYTLINDPANAVEFAVSGSPSDTTNFLTVFGSTAGETNYFITDIPMIRISEDPAIGINEESTSNVALGQNIPNPFNGEAMIPFSLVDAADVEFVITDMSGKIIEKRDLGVLSAGDHNINVASGNLAGGVYYYTIIANGKKTTKKMSVIK